MDFLKKKKNKAILTFLSILMFTAQSGGLFYIEILIWLFLRHLYSISLLRCLYRSVYSDDVTCIISLLHGSPEHRLTPFTPHFRLSTGGGYAHSHLELVLTLSVWKRHIKGVLHTIAVRLSNNNKQETDFYTTFQLDTELLRIQKYSDYYYYSTLRWWW